MPKKVGEEHWQYMGRMAELARRILELARTEPIRKVWFFALVADRLDAPIEDIVAACHTPDFTGEAHARDGFFFLKTREEKADDLDWTLGTGRFSQ